MNRNKKETIINLYYIEHLKVKEIANILNVDSSYITRIIKNDNRYLEEKNNRKVISKQKHIESTKISIKKSRDIKKFNNSADDLILKKIHRQASIELSKGKHLSNENYRKWNYSAYRYNSSKKRYEFCEELGRSYDVPKYIKERKKTSQ